MLFPIELIVQIASYCTATTLLALSSSCKAYKSIATTDSYWKSLLLSDNPYKYYLRRPLRPTYLETYKLVITEGLHVFSMAICDTQTKGRSWLSKLTDESYPEDSFTTMAGPYNTTKGIVIIEFDYYPTTTPWFDVPSRDYSNIFLFGDFNISVGTTLIAIDSKTCKFVRTATFPLNDTYAPLVYALEYHLGNIVYMQHAKCTFEV